MLNRISESELILNPDGGIYHLHIKPENLADTVITVGDPDRVGIVSAHFDSIEFKGQKREFVTHTGTYKGTRITVLSTGIGPDNIDIVLNELDALVNINLETRMEKEVKKVLRIIRMGTSGSLQADIPGDSLVVSTHGIGLDNVLHFYNYTKTDIGLLADFLSHTQLPNTAVVPYIAPASSELLSKFGDEYHRGITVTCGGFYGPQGRILRAPLAFPDLIDKLPTFQSNGYRIANFEMETSAIYGLGRILGHQCVSVNTIVANRVNKTFSRNPAVAIENMICKTLDVIVS